ncbi:MAG: alkaline phosphatase family protein [Candidatus Polarisedimenticolia bacterium]
MTSPDRPSLAEVRERLRDRGYLEGRLSLWVATGRGGAASLLRLALAASLRVGLLGGAILAVPAAAALALANRPHIHQVREVIWLWLFLAILLGASLAALELTAELMLAWLARRGLILLGRAERLAGRVGLLFAAAATLYLIFYVRGGRMSASAPVTGSTLPGWLLWGAVMLGALGAAHVVGRLARLGSLATLFASAAGHLSPPRADGRWGRVAAFAFWGAALVMGGLLVFAPEAPDAPPAPAAPVVEPLPVPGRVILVGVDGLDASLMDQLVDRGELQMLRTLAGKSVRYDLRSEEPPVPPRRWTTVATGLPSDLHGVLGYQAGRVPGLSSPVQDPASSLWPLSPRLLLPPRVAASAPVDARLRRASAVWEILTEHGVRAAAVNWWASWPATKSGGGVVVSDRTFPRLMADRAADRDAVPPELERDLNKSFPSDLEWAKQRLVASGLTQGGPAAAAALADAWHARVGVRLLADPGLRVLMLYLPSLDIARRSQPTSLPGVLSSLDLLLGDLMEQLREDDLLLLAADPGRGGNPVGVLLVHGTRAVREAGPRAGARLLDLAPTLLALAGLPTADDLPGRPVLDFLTEGDPARRTRPPIATYGGRSVRETEETADDPFQDEALDRLRGLGYIQ